MGTAGAGGSPTTGSGGSGGEAGGPGGTSGAGGDIPDAGPVPTDASAPRDTGVPPVSVDAGGSPFGGGPVTTSTTHLDIGVHDPAMIWDGSRYYLFATGGTLNIRSSTNMMQWTNAGRVLNAIPAWAITAVGSNPGSLWAPDVSYFNGRFHVYYAASTFGSNVSAIGLATNTSLNPQAAGYAWTDAGLVVQSTARDNFNAIDPNVAFDASGNPWLSFGSFWSGIKMIRLDPATGKQSASDTTIYSLASRNGGAIEAPSIVSHNGFYYLFVSFDRCCAGVNSTYRTMAGRATSITGPYTDSTGRAMLQSGGDQLIATAGRYIGPGGGTAWRNGDTYLYSFHYYDGMANGASKLQIRPINWTADNWPTLGDPLFP